MWEVKRNDFTPCIVIFILFIHIFSSYQIIQVIKTLLTRSGWFIKIERKAIVTKITTQTSQIDRIATPDEKVTIFFQGY